MKFTEIYTTAEKKSKDAKEKDKEEISSDAYAICLYLEKLTQAVRTFK